MPSKNPVKLTILALAGVSLFALDLSDSAASAGDLKQARPHGHAAHHGGSHHRDRRHHARNSLPDVNPFSYSRDKRSGRHHRGRRGDGFYGDGPLPDHIPGLGTYSGAISAVRDRHNGIYFYIEEDQPRGYVIDAPRIPSRPKIITVGPDAFEAACDRSAGVCVIRP